MNAFSRSWMITKLAFGVINKDRELIGMALLSFLFSTAFVVAMVFPTIISPITENGFSEEGFQTFEYLIIFLTYFGLAFIATFFNVCVVYTTKIRFEGGNATFAESIRFGFSRIGLIAQWSLISATVGLLLRILSDLAQQFGKVGQIVAQIIISMIGMAWSIATIFVVPVLVYENVGPIDAIKKSTTILKKTWGESLVRSIGLGLMQLLTFVLIILLSVGLTYLLTISFDAVGFFIGLGIGLALLLFAGLIFSVATTIFNTALYVYADRNMVAEGFDQNVVRDAFKLKEQNN